MANEQNLKPWQKGQSGNPNGRPRKLFSSVNKNLKEKGYEELTRTQLMEGLGLLLNLDEVELKEMAKDKDIPYALRIMILDLNDSKKRTQALRDYRDYLFGRASQPIEPKIPKGTKVHIDFTSD